MRQRHIPTDTKGSPLLNPLQAGVVGRNQEARSMTIDARGANLPSANETLISVVASSWSQPTQAQIHDINSTDAGDVGTSTSGTATISAGSEILIDDNAAFLTDGVQVGSVLYNVSQNVFGYVSAVVSETRLNIEDTLRVTPVESFVMYVDDTYRIERATGTGVGVVLVEGLDASYLERSEIIILNGTTNVPTTIAYRMVNKITALSIGSNNASEGEIDATAQVDGTITTGISTGQNESHHGAYMVPADRTLLVHALVWTLSTTNLGIVIKKRPHLGGGEIELYRALDGSLQLDEHIYFEVPLRLPPKSLFLTYVTDKPGNTTLNMQCHTSIVRS